jgi:hypothetical protein
VRSRASKRFTRRTGVALAAAALLICLVAAVASAERAQRGDLIVTLDGGLSPLELPRGRPAPVTVRLSGGLQTTDGAELPQVTQIELGLPGRGVISTLGLPVCPQRKLRNASPAGALAACGSAYIGEGELEAQVTVPNQAPFHIDASLLAFNGRVRGHRAVLLHAFTSQPPTVIVLPFLLHLEPGPYGTNLIAYLPPALGPWPHLEHFRISLFRRYSYRGRMRSYLSSSCPIPRNLTAGFFSFAHATYTLGDGRRIGTGITRGCRASHVDS